MYLGIDLGTSEVKALLMASTGRIVAGAGRPLQVLRPHVRWSEQVPEDWWQCTLGAIEHLRQSHGAELAAVRSIGLAGQMHGATLLDEANRVLRPAILWNDTRADTQCLELMIRAPSLELISGNLAMPGFTAPKLLWVAEHEPDIFKRTAAVLLPKDYLRLRLTGEKVSDRSDASGTLWLDVGARAWSDALLAASRLTTKQMPALVEGSAISGELRKELADLWGMRHPVAVAGGAGDNAASAVGMGAVMPGDGLVSLGTSGVIFFVSDGFRPNPQSAVHAFCHALPNRWHQMSVMLSAASCLRWAVQITGARDEAALLAEISSIDNSVRHRAPIFLPYLSGERTPHNDPHAQGVFFGLTHETDRAALGYSVVEGVAFGLADGLAALKTAGSRIHTLSLVGGGARSEYWAQLIATTLDLSIRTHAGAEAGAALGAARLAQLACGGSESDVCRKPDCTAEFVPQAELVPMLEERLQRFRSLYTATKPVFNQQNA
jgi:xylulokinase